MLKIRTIPRGFFLFCLLQSQRGGRGRGGRGRGGNRGRGRGGGGGAGAAPGGGAGTHTIILIQPENAKSSRTFRDYQTKARAMDGKPSS